MPVTEFYAMLSLQCSYGTSLLIGLSHQRVARVQALVSLASKAFLATHEIAKDVSPCGLIEIYHNLVIV